MVATAGFESVRFKTGDVCLRRPLSTRGSAPLRNGIGCWRGRGDGATSVGPLRRTVHRVYLRSAARRVAPRANILFREVRSVAGLASLSGNSADLASTCLGKQFRELGAGGIVLALFARWAALPRLRLDGEANQCCRRHACSNLFGAVLSVKRLQGLRIYGSRVWPARLRNSNRHHRGWFVRRRHRPRRVRSHWRRVCYSLGTPICTPYRSSAWTPGGAIYAGKQSRECSMLNERGERTLHLKTALSRTPPCDCEKT